MISLVLLVLGRCRGCRIPIPAESEAHAAPNFGSLPVRNGIANQMRKRFRIAKLRLRISAPVPVRDGIANQMRDCVSEFGFRFSDSAGIMTVGGSGADQ